MSNRRMLFEGYQAKPKPALDSSQRGLQASGTANTRPPTGNRLPEKATSTIRTPKSK